MQQWISDEFNNDLFLPLTLPLISESSVEEKHFHQMSYEKHVICDRKQRFFVTKSSVTYMS